LTNAEINRTLREVAARKAKNNSGIVNRLLIILNARESLEFARILLSPPRPGAVLRKAAERYHKINAAS
jgi:uncharacterized protein (DUF1778 family)